MIERKDAHVQQWIRTEKKEESIISRLEKDLSLPETRNS